MKNLLIGLVLLLTVFATSAMAVDGFKIGLINASIDGAYMFEPGKYGAFFATGVGSDLIRYEYSATKNSKLAFAIHGSALAKVTGPDRTPLFGMGLNMDLLKLFCPNGVKIITKEVLLQVGPAMAYDIGTGRLAYGGIMSFSYNF